MSRGLEVIWVAENFRSYKKLVPACERYPSSNIVTVDDDVVYAPWMLERLLDAHNTWPEAIVGHRGRWIQCSVMGTLTDYASWPKASPETPPCRVLLTGVGGILYPAGLLDRGLVIDLETAMALCPDGDDIWFWGVARKGNVPVRCIAGPQPSFRPLPSEARLPSLHRDGEGIARNDRQLSQLIDHWDLSDRLQCL